MKRRGDPAPSGVFERQLAANLLAWKAKRQTIGRKVTEWRGKTADAMPPPTVRARILETWDGICFYSKVMIDLAKGFDLEHLVSVKDGGIAANCESNLRPVLKDPHIVRTAREKREQSLASRKKRAAAGIKAAPKKMIETAPAPVRPPQNKASTVEKDSKLATIMALPRRAMFR